MERNLYLILGGNQGDTFAYIAQAQKLIATQIGHVAQRSQLVESEPWGFSHEQNFVNQALRVETKLTPQQVLAKIHQIEQLLGRQRLGTGYHARTMDIDILFYGDTILNDNDLHIPHLRLHERRFTLVPLAEIAPDFVHPIFGQTIRQLLDECDDDGFVRTCQMAQIAH